MKVEFPHEASDWKSEPGDLIDSFFRTLTVDFRGEIGGGLTTGESMVLIAVGFLVNEFAEEIDRMVNEALSGATLSSLLDPATTAATRWANSCGDCVRAARLESFTCLAMDGSSPMSSRMAKLSSLRTRVLLLGGAILEPLDGKDFIEGRGFSKSCFSDSFDVSCSDMDLEVSAVSSVMWPLVCLFRSSD